MGQAASDAASEQISDPPLLGLVQAGRASGAQDGAGAAGTALGDQATLVGGK